MTIAWIVVVVSVVGLQTRLQRLVGGNLLDGQDVLVDYAFDVGGTFALKQTDQTLNVDWSLGNTLSLYFRYLDSAPRLASGAPTTPLNAVQSMLYGLRADGPWDPSAARRNGGPGAGACASQATT